MVTERKRRPKQSGRVSFVMRLDPLQHQQLKERAQQQNVTMALIVESYLKRALIAEKRLLEQEDVATEENGSLAQLCADTQIEVKDLIGWEWLQLSEKRKLALVYLAVFPYEPPWRLARMSRISRQWLSKVKRSSIGVKVVNHFSDRSLWSRRPELLKSVIDKAIESDEPAWSELALRIFGDYGARVNRQVTVAVEGQPTKMPVDLEQQFIEQAKLLKMTPKRFKKLWQQESTRARLTSETSARL